MLDQRRKRWADIVQMLYKCFVSIVGFTLTVVDEFRLFLSQFSINFHEILYTLFFIHVVTTLKVSRSI